jgi:hypothetical protein
MNSGMASMVKLWDVEIDFWTSTVIGRFRMIKKEKPDRPMEKATGIPSSKNTKKIPIAANISPSPSLFLS